MKILYINPRSRGSLGIYDNNLLENIYGEKYFFAAEDFQFYKIDDTKIIYEYSYYKKISVLKALSYMKSQIRILKWIYNNNPGIIHIQWIRIPFFDTIILLMIKLLSKKSKIVYTAHNLLPHDKNRQWNKYAYYIFYHLCNGIIVHTERTIKELIDMFSLKKVCIKEIPHGSLKYGTEYPKERMYKNKILFSITGVMSYYKGIDILIDAWISSKTLMENNDIHLLIAGSGFIPIEKIPKDKNITVINRILADNEYQQIIYNTDVGILPYRQISQSGVLLTLLTEHKPVIVSDCGGLTQPFQMGKVGWIINELSSNGLAETIINVVHNKDELLEIQADIALWNKIDDYYSWKNIGRMTNDFYSALISST